MAPRKNYSQQQMNFALQLVQRGSSVAAAAKQAGVPRITLLYKASGKSPKECSMGPATSLSAEEEELLVRWILELSKIHYPVSKHQLMDSVEEIIKKKPRENHFKNGRPGDKWFSRFLKRHPELATRVSQNLTVSRESVTEDKIRSWFSEIRAYLTEKNYMDIFNEPERVFNSDESAFYLSPKADKVIVRKGTKNVYNVSGDEKENLTVLVTANASGTLAPPMIVFKYNRIPKHISASIPEEWGIGTSENGWMCGPTFFGYITNIFEPWLTKNNIKRPVLFFMDGHVSHMTLHLSNFCLSHGIELIALYPNSTHILQPMDVAVFRPLKSKYKEEVSKWRTANYQVKLQKQNFASVLGKALDQVTPVTIQNGFRASGICPFNVENVHFQKISSKNQMELPANEHDATQESQSEKIFLRKLEEKIGKPKIIEFKNILANNAECFIEDTSLFALWKSLHLQEQINITNNKDVLTEPGPSSSSRQKIQNPDLNFANLMEKTPIKSANSIPDIATNNPVLKSTAPFVPSPFKDVLFWPEPSQKKNIKEK